MGLQMFGTTRDGAFSKPFPDFERLSKDRNHLQETSGISPHKTYPSSYTLCRPKNYRTTRIVTPQTGPALGPTTHIGAQKPGIWAGNAAPRSSGDCIHGKHVQCAI